MRGLPQDGLVGEQALREAARGSYQEIMEQVAQVVRARLKLPSDKPVWAHVVALFPETVVVAHEDRMIRYGWSRDDAGRVTLDEGEAVIAQEVFVPAEDRLKEAAGGGLVEAGEAGADRGSRFEVRVIREGLSGNGVLYPADVLERAVNDGLFEGTKVLVKSDDVHLAGVGGKHPTAVLGRLTEARWVAGKGQAPGEVRATLDVLRSAGDLPARLVEAVDRGMSTLFGLSIDANARVRKSVMGGRKVQVATQFTKVHSVDLIVDPGAGGEILRVIEAQQTSTHHQGTPDMDRAEILARLRAARPDLAAGADALTDTALLARLTEALAAPADDAAGEARLTEAQVRRLLDERDRLQAARDGAVATIAASSLPPAARERLTAEVRVAEAQALTPEAVEKRITDEAAYLKTMIGGGRVHGLGRETDARVTEERDEKVAKMLDAFFDPADTTVRSIRECYIEITGDARVTGNPRDCDPVRLREALGSATFADVLGDGMHRRMVAEYRNQTNIDSWRQVCTVVPMPDFRNKELTRYGGYGDLPEVAENGPYTALTSPSDEKAEYKVAKRGGLESVTLEMIKNDDVGVVQRLPQKMARAAKRTLAKFVWDFIRTNPVIYDGKALFHVDHGNLGTAALDAASFAAARLAMMQQTELDSGEPLWIGPAFLAVPAMLEETAANLFRRNTENDKTFIQSLTPTILPVFSFTDANDWAVIADPADIPTIEVGFLDGQEEPELFVADNPRAGALFTNDRIEYKIRHIYGGAVADFRGLYKAVVV